MRTLPVRLVLISISLALLISGVMVIASEDAKPVAHAYIAQAAAPKNQTLKLAQEKSTGCASCHTSSDHSTMHSNPAVILGCTDCHGGDASINKPDHSDYTAAHSGKYKLAMTQAHIPSRYPIKWKYPSSANPPRTYTLLNREAPEYVRFINPGDLRVARLACGACHLPIIRASERSLMSTSAMLWGGASYNNGILPFKRYILGEAYTGDSQPAFMKNPVPVTPEMTAMGILPSLAPLPAWETVPPGDIFRVFERGGRVINTQFPEIGLPNNVRGSFQGTARTAQESQGQQPLLILAALVVIYIVLGILYESLIHPITVLSTLPSAGVGAVLALMIFKLEFSVIALIGVFLLIGIVKKNAILIIDFAIDAERSRGLTALEAVREACLLRFRPILMTTMAAILGALPLAIGFGEGAELRRPLGIAIIGGLVASQLLTLLTTPVVYVLLDKLRRRGAHDQHLARVTS